MKAVRSFLRGFGSLLDIWPAPRPRRRRGLVPVVARSGRIRWVEPERAKLIAEHWMTEEQAEAFLRQARDMQGDSQ